MPLHSVLHTRHGPQTRTVTRAASRSPLPESCRNRAGDIIRHDRAISSVSGCLRFPGFARCREGTGQTLQKVHRAGNGRVSIEGGAMRCSLRSDFFCVPPRTPLRQETQAGSPEIFIRLVAPGTALHSPR
jgi:hypothetical protein